MVGQKRILIVDDEEMIRDMLHAVLGDAGYAVTVAADGAAARSILAEQAFDAVLLDDVMPGEGAARVAEQAQELAIPVLMMSGHPDAIIRQGGKVTPFIAKPFRVKELLDALSALVKA